MAAMRRPEWVKDYRLESGKTATVGIYVDWDAISAMVLKASKSKGRKSRDGAITVEVLNGVWPNIATRNQAEGRPPGSPGN